MCARDTVYGRYADERWVSSAVDELYSHMYIVKVLNAVDSRVKSVSELPLPTIICCACFIMFSSCGGICAWSGKMFPRFAFGPLFSEWMAVDGFGALVCVPVCERVCVSVRVCVRVNVSLFSEWMAAHGPGKCFPDSLSALYSLSGWV